MLTGWSVKLDQVKLKPNGLRSKKNTNHNTNNIFSNNRVHLSYDRTPSFLIYPSMIAQSLRCGVAKVLEECHIQLAAGCIILVALLEPEHPEPPV